MSGCQMTVRQSPVKMTAGAIVINLLCERCMNVTKDERGWVFSRCLWNVLPVERVTKCLWRVDCHFTDTGLMYALATLIVVSVAVPIVVSKWHWSSYDANWRVTGDVDLLVNSGVDCHVSSDVDSLMVVTLSSVSVVALTATLVVLCQ